MTSAGERTIDTERPGATVGPPVPFDAELAPILEALAGLVPQSMRPEDIERFRARLAATALSDEDLARSGVFTVETVAAPVAPGEPDVPLLVCRPTGVAVPAAAVYFIHGGGMVLGNARTGLHEALDWAAELGLVVVSPDHRLAPEHPYPAAVTDCYAGLVWTAGQLTELGVDSGRLLVSGSSAGGGLAAALALMARDRGGPALTGQLLLGPMLDDRNDSVSARQMAGLGIWDRTSNATGWAALLGDAAGGPDVSPFAAPARATDLSGLPPAFLDVGSAETFRDENVAYAAAIWAAGGSAELHVWPGAFHGSDLIAPTAAVSRAARAARVNWLRRQL
ncbi:alpha/beta hydrolase fold domain-containing protein [Frankia sp. AgB1.9]|uniref:alpha/beta hydrolase fold domain-containing protein n=1 Tax=unclassified Frankia TaxID=2632575 RepID=UPI0019313A2F|nr:MULTISPECIES: alpha/beta hydrolase fold domain-containing protein [unclassified Frankia]MBL7486914.1 alpha/beta hydrolase fold domain-containing protein [Frankia sp. AgW1.1]MBL7547199.1 alpha/beta hydrolase fold domain-containing protein [Frankia sp. AgB1.9]MBL7624009.1 alpha/beta hydrolase fold domain-containing protein [Frankia sp. AgB1.8]